MTEDDHNAKLAREANVFSGKSNDKIRQTSFNSISYFGERLNAELHYVNVAMEMLQSAGSINALSLACGDMKGEYSFFKRIGVKSIDCFDISEGQRSRFLDTVYDGSIPVNYGIADVNTVVLPEAAYDVVYMQQSLHHIMEIDALLSRIKLSLKESGIFVLNDYIGEPFLQRSPTQRRICQSIWQALPSRLRTNTSNQVLDTIHIPRKETLSPFEAAKSLDILPGLHKHFRTVKKITYGGIIFPIFNGFAQNYRSQDELDCFLIKHLWDLDRLLDQTFVIEPNFVRGIFMKS